MIENLSLMTPKRNLSIEYEFFPFVLKKYSNRIFGFKSEEKLLDIGTPKNLNLAETIFRRKYKNTVSTP